jgi:hypothetical protein
MVKTRARLVVIVGSLTLAVLPLAPQGAAAAAGAAQTAAMAPGSGLGLLSPSTRSWCC